MVTCETFQRFVSHVGYMHSTEMAQMLLNDLIRGAKGVEADSGGRIRARQVYHMVENGQLPVIRKGRSMYFRRSELEAAFRSDAAA